MTTLTLPTRVIHYPDPRLRQSCEPIEQFGEELAAFAARMLELMHAERGVGLAAPQVGVCKCLFVCNPTGKPEDDAVYVNPSLSDLAGSVEAEEGCLSIPDVRVIVRRARKCTIRAFNVKGEPLEVAAEELPARIWQHEFDHLEGRLIIDRMNGADRIATKKQLAQLEADYKRARPRA